LGFQFYSVEEIVDQTRQRGDEVLTTIAERSRGTPHLALRLLQACRRVCRSEGENVITPAHVERACELEQIDSLGLGRIDQQYLRILVEGASRLNVVASRLGQPSRTVADVTEPYLIRSGLVTNGDQSRRQLTAAGREHLWEGCADGV
jgi:Holliday junction DNA helicase RuvB